MIEVRAILVPVLMAVCHTAAAQSVSNHQLAAQSNDPGAPLVALNVQNTYSPRNHGGKGWSNELQFQPVIPVGPFGPIRMRSIHRPTVPLEMSARPNRKTGLGDIQLLSVFVPDAGSSLTWGLGAEFTFPTANHGMNGEEKWVAGPALYLLYSSRGSTWQIGAIARERISFAGRSIREDIHELVVQPILQHNIGGGWYVSMGDLDWSFDWRDQGAATIPAALQIGRVTTIGNGVYNIALEGAHYVARHGSGPDSSIRLQISLLLPSS